MSISPVLNTLALRALMASDAAYFTNRIFSRPPGGVTDPSHLYNGDPLRPLNDPPDYYVPLQFDHALLGGGHVVDFQYVHPTSGFKFVAFKNEATNDLILAFGGTDGLNPTDWKSNLSSYGWSQWNSARSQVFAYLNTLPRNGAELTVNLSFTGQSLGGALAQYAAYEWVKAHRQDASRIALTTFNGLGGLYALNNSENVPGGYDQSVLSGLGMAANFVVQSDIVSRLGGGFAAGPVYQLQYDADKTNPNTGEKYSLGFIESHRIESGFYANLQADGFSPAIQLTGYALSRYSLETPNLADGAALLGTIFNGKGTIGSDLVDSLAALATAGAWCNPVEFDRVVRAYFDDLHERKVMGDAAFAFWSTVRLPGELLGKGASIALAPALLMGTTLASTLEFGGIAIQKVMSKIGDFLGFPSSEPESSLVETNEMQVKTTLFLSSVPGNPSPSPALARELQGLNLNPSEFAAQLLATNGNPKWFNDTLENLRSRANPQDATYGVRLASAVAEAIGEIPEMPPTLMAALTEDLNDFVLDTAKGIRNGAPDILTALQDTSFSLGRTLGFGEYQSYVKDVVSLLGSITVNPALKLTLEAAKLILETGGQSLVLQQGVGQNPFEAEGFDPDAVPPVTFNLNEGQLTMLTLHLPFEAGVGGQKLHLALNGTNANTFVLRTGELELTPEGNHFTLTIPEGQRNLTVGLRAKQDVAISSTLNVTATLVDANNNPTHETGLEATIALADTGGLADGTPPTIDFTNGWSTLTNADYPFTETDDRHYLGRDGYNVVLHAYGGNDFVSVSGGGNDEVHGDAGHDVIHGQGGNDRLFGGTENDQLTGDVYSMTTSDDLLDGGSEDDWLVGSAGHDTLLGGDGIDHLFGDDEMFSVLTPGGGDDFLDGGAGDDRLRGDYGTDSLLGGDGNDTLWGDYHQHMVGPALIGPFSAVAFDTTRVGDDYLDGGAGDDTLYGDGGDDTVLGGDGGDQLYGDFGESSFYVPEDMALQSQGGDDYLDGQGGDDTINAGGGHDILLGGAGNDTLYGDDASTRPSQAGEDWLEGGEGDDVLFGGGASDALFGGDGADVLIGDYGQTILIGSDDTLDGGAGNDELQGGVGDDLLDGGSENDRLFGQEGGDILYGGTGADELQGQVGDDVLDGEEGIDTLYGQEGHDVLYGGLDGDFLYGNEGNDLLSGDEGDDQLVGGSGVDILNGGSGADLLFGDEDDDTLLGEDGADELQGGAGNDLLSGDAGNDRLFGQAGADQLFGDAGDDILIGDAGDDLLYGDAGEDQLAGGAGADRLEGGAGNDLFDGGQGADTYLFSLGDGFDTITDLVGEGNRLVFGAGISAESLRLEAGTGNALVVRVGNSEDAVQIAGFNVFDPLGLHPIDQFEFADGTILTYGQLLERGVQRTLPAVGGTLYGSSLRDLIQGSQVNDVIFAREGDDVLRGGAGNDSLIGEEGNDSLYGDEGADYLWSGLGNDVLYGGMDDDRLEGGDGHDTLYGDSGHDLLIGGDGDDHLYGGAGDDRLHADTGADVLEGGTGNDTYVITHDGQTVIEASNAGVDTIQARFSGTGTYVLPDHIENIEWLDLGLEETDNRPNFVGNALDNVMTGPALLDGKAGNDLLIGTADNTYVFGRGYGQDIVRTGVQGYVRTGQDQVQFLAGISPSDLIVENHANHLVLKINGTSDQLTVESYLASPADTVDQFVFADGTVWTEGDITSRVTTFVGSEGDDTFYGGFGDDTIRGLGGNDQIRANTGNDVLDGGAGIDFLEGSIGNDTYIFGRGYGQDAIDEQGDFSDVDTVRLAEGITPGDVVLQATPGNGTDVLLTLPGTQDQLALGSFFSSAEYRVDQIQFADGTLWDYNAMVARVQGVNLTGTDEVDYLSGNLTNDTLSGMGGDDSLYGVAGNDTLSGGAGADYLDGGSGNDTLDGGTGVDTMIGGSGNDLYVVDAAGDVVTELSGQGTDTVESSLTYTLGSNVENLTLTGTAAVNGTGNSLNNTLAGNGGANILTGGTGNDTYIVGAGDTVVEAASGGTDTVRSDVSWTLGTNIEHLVLTGAAAINGTGNTLANTLTGNNAANVLNGGSGADTMSGGQGDDTYLVDNTADKTTELANEGIDTVQSSVSYTLASNVENLTLTGTSSSNGTGNALDNLLVGNSAANTLTGGAGNDTYVIGTGDTVVEAASAGTDTVQSSITYTLGSNVENLTLTGTSAINGTGNSLNNVLIGNSAANTLTGGAGNDTYVVGASDTVVEAAGAGTDTVQSSVTWTLGANLENLTLTGSGAINGTGNAMANVLSGNDAANMLSGGDGNDTLAGGKGNDALNGGTGNDVFQFSRGDGQDTVTDNSGTADRLDLSSGINPLDLILSRSANDLRIALYGSTDQMTIANWYGGATNQLETIKASNGLQLVNTQVDQLIQAMAAFTQQSGLSWEQAIAQRPQDVQSILAASWK